MRHERNACDVYLSAPHVFSHHFPPPRCASASNHRPDRQAITRQMEETPRLAAQHSGRSLCNVQDYPLAYSKTHVHVSPAYVDPRHCRPGEYSPHCRRMYAIIVQ
ncbi:hypothetical protein EI94DRAFT_1738386 [Lactarius quietus]|nr:hypothetical protein EI94DRAFT_1738386 [Lactarius quietus]